MAADGRLSGKAARSLLHCADLTGSHAVTVTAAVTYRRIACPGPGRPAFTVASAGAASPRLCTCRVYRHCGRYLVYDIGSGTVIFVRQMR